MIGEQSSCWRLTVAPNHIEQTETRILKEGLRAHYLKHYASQSVSQRLTEQQHTKMYCTDEPLGFEGRGVLLTRLSIAKCWTASPQLHAARLSCTVDMQQIL